MKKNGKNFTNLKGSTTERLRAARGVGDVVALVAEPIALIVDKVFKTDIKNCKGCPNRQDYLNRKLPFNNGL